MSSSKIDLYPGSYRNPFQKFQNQKNCTMECVIVRMGEERKDWRLLEVQGNFSIEDGSSIKDGLDIGTLELVDGVYRLHVGNHLLEGKTVNLKKPFAVLDRATNDSSFGDNDDFLVTGIIREKIVFKTRPKPMMKKSKIHEE